MIGTAKTLSPYFKGPRFNGWVVGEVYVVSQDLIPNARRDDFERNDTFNSFEKGIRETVGSVVSDKIRSASKARNNPAEKKIRKAEKTISNTKRLLTDGFHSTFEKEQTIENISSTIKELKAIPKSNDPEVIQKKALLMESLSSLEDEVSGSSNYRTQKDITSDFSKAERKMVRAMLEVLTRNFERETVDSLYKEFLIELKTKGKR